MIPRAQLYVYRAGASGTPIRRGYGTAYGTAYVCTCIFFLKKTQSITQTTQPGHCKSRFIRLMMGDGTLSLKKLK
eukprot:COSAG02_NODE_61028_length_269_cov_1.335294_1_plen_74_part_01